MGAKSLSLETALPEPAVTTSKGRAPSFMEHVMAKHTVTKANEDMNGTIVESDSDAIDYKP